MNYIITVITAKANNIAKLFLTRCAHGDTICPRPL